MLSFRNLLKIFKSYEIFEIFLKIFKSDAIFEILNLKKKLFYYFENIEILIFFVEIFEIFRNFDLFCNLLGRLEMKSCLWLDNIETLNIPPEAHAR